MKLKQLNKPANTSQQKVEKSLINQGFSSLPGTSKQLVILNYFFRKKDYFARTRATHQQIAEWAGSSISTVRRTIDLYIQYGVLRSTSHKISWDYNAPNLYEIVSDYLSQDFMDWFELYIGNICRFPLFKILSKPALAENEQPYINIRNITSAISRLRDHFSESFFNETQLPSEDKLPPNKSTCHSSTGSSGNICIAEVIEPCVICEIFQPKKETHGAVDIGAADANRAISSRYNRSCSSEVEGAFGC